MHSIAQPYTCHYFTERLSQEVNAIGSVRMSVCLFPFYLFNRLTVDLDHSSQGIDGQELFRVVGLISIEGSLCSTCSEHSGSMKVAQLNIIIQSVL